MPCPGLGGLRRGYSLWGGGGGPPPSPPGSVPPWITSGFSWSRVGLAKWFIRMQGSDTSRLACFFKDLQSILWQCFTWKARYCNASLLLSPLSLSPQPYLSSTSRASSLWLNSARRTCANKPLHPLKGVRKRTPYGVCKRTP